MVNEKLSESCREAIDIVVTSCIRYKAIVKEKLAEALIAIKQKNIEKAEEIVKDLLIFLDT
jgi:flagellin-specific chaperone FliS